MNTVVFLVLHLVYAYPTGTHAIIDVIEAPGPAACEQMGQAVMRLAGQARIVAFECVAVKP